MSLADPGNRWYCPCLGSLLWETWEDEHFIFNPHSGETHVLNALAGAILRALAERPLLVSDLAERFGELLAQGSAAEKAQLVAALLGQLDQLGLIERRDP